MGLRWLYVYLLIEFQSRSDRRMALRLLVYVGLLYQDLLKAKQLARGERFLPPVLPIVLYNEVDRWTAATALSELIEPPPAGLEPYQPAIRYLLLDEARYRDEELSQRERNLAATLFQLEKSRTLEGLAEMVGALRAWLAAPEQASLRRAFAEWIERVLLPLRLPGIEIPELQDLDEIDAMLAERVIEWTKEWKQQGLEEGRKQGRKQGRREERERALVADRQLLVRLSNRRFGQNWTETLQKLLETLDDPEQVVTIGEWIIDSPDGKTLIERVEKLLN